MPQETIRVGLISIIGFLSMSILLYWGYFMCSKSIAFECVGPVSMTLALPMTSKYQSFCQLLSYWSITRETLGLHSIFLTLFKLVSLTVLGFWSSTEKMAFPSETQHTGITWGIASWSAVARWATGHNLKISTYCLIDATNIFPTKRLTDLGYSGITHYR